MRDIIDTFVTLGQRLESVNSSAMATDLYSRAIEQNPWFTETDIKGAINAICNDMLRREHLEPWLKNYNTNNTPRRVAIIMAGNIPLVGFFDLLCVLCSGHEAHIKPSSKDSVLMRYVVSQLKEIDPNIPIFDYDATQSYDMAIATGGEDANRYFEQHFASTPRLLRSSRHSIAILDGSESSADIEGLWHDITAYSGLGCRSISMIFAPRNHTMPSMHGEPSNKKLKGILTTTRALYRMKGIPHIDCGAFIITEGNNFPTTLAAVTLYPYDNIQEVTEWIATHKDDIQCIVAHAVVENSVPFGHAQRPTLYDYADGVDTMAMLNI